MKWLERFASKAVQRANSRLEKANAELQTALEAERRRLEVANAEIESMAGVIARDRQRIMAEGAAYARDRAVAEGHNNHERDNASAVDY